MKQSPNYTTLNQAAIWFSVLQSDDVTPEDHQQWKLWIAQDDSHYAAWQHVESISTGFAPIRHHNAQMDSALSHQLIQPYEQSGHLQEARVFNRRTVLKGLVSLPVLAGLWKAHQMDLIDEWTLPYRADLSNSKRVAIKQKLSDGALITLAIKSGISVSLANNPGELTLLAGDIAIEQATASSPLLIKHPNANITIQQSHIVIRQSSSYDNAHNPQVADIKSGADPINFSDTHSTQVSLFKGEAQIQLTGTHNSKRILAGQKAFFSSSDISPTQRSSQMDLAWTNNILKTSNMRLSNWASIVNQHHTSYLNCHPAINNLKVMGSFPMDNTALALSMLQSVLPVRTRQITPLWTLIEPA